MEKIRTQLIWQGLQNKEYELRGDASLLEWFYSYKKQDKPLPDAFLALYSCLHVVEHKRGSNTSIVHNLDARWMMENNCLIFPHTFSNKEQGERDAGIIITGSWLYQSAVFLLLLLQQTCTYYCRNYICHAVLDSYKYDDESFVIDNINFIWNCFLGLCRYFQIQIMKLDTVDIGKPPPPRFELSSWSDWKARD